MNIDRLREAFGGAEFTVRDAAALLGLGLDAARHVLRDLRVRGLLERVDRGRYRVLADSNRLRIEAKRHEIRLERALTTDLRVALDGPDAVRAWTRNRFTVGGQNHILHVAVHADDLADYRRHLEYVDLPYGPVTAEPGGHQPYVVLRAVDDLRPVDLDGTPTLDRESTLALVRENPVAYGGAEEWFS